MSASRFVSYPAHPLGPECWPNPGDCRKLTCYRCGRYDGVKHNGGTGPNGELLFDDMHRWWWNHDWMTYWRNNNNGGCWVRSFPGGRGHVMESFYATPGDRTGNQSRYIREGQPAYV